MPRQKRRQERRYRAGQAEAAVEIAVNCSSARVTQSERHSSSHKRRALRRKVRADSKNHTYGRRQRAQRQLLRPGIVASLSSPLPPSKISGGVLYHERSEEHTSELQSRLHLVCRLLLEKKKTRYNTSVRALDRHGDSVPRPHQPPPAHSLSILPVIPASRKLTPASWPCTSPRPSRLAAV